MWFHASHQIDALTRWWIDYFDKFGNQSKSKLTFCVEGGFTEKFRHAKKSLADVRKISTCDAHMIENSQSSSLCSSMSQMRPPFSVSKYHIIEAQYGQTSNYYRLFHFLTAQRANPPRHRDTRMCIWSPINYSMNLIFMLLRQAIVCHRQQCKQGVNTVRVKIVWHGDISTGLYRRNHVIFINEHMSNFFALSPPPSPGQNDARSCVQADARYVLFTIIYTRRA